MTHAMLIPLLSVRRYHILLQSHGLDKDQAHNALPSIRPSARKAQGHIGYHILHIIHLTTEAPLMAHPLYRPQRHVPQKSRRSNRDTLTTYRWRINAGT